MGARHSSRTFLLQLGDLFGLLGNGGVPLLQRPAEGRSRR